MKYQKYLVLAFVAALFLPLLSAKSPVMKKSELNLNSVVFIELEEMDELGFDTAAYLPENFDPFSTQISINTLNYIEEEIIDLGFDTQDYLPKNFDAFSK